MLATIEIKPNQSVQEISEHIKTELANETNYLFHITGATPDDDLEKFYDALSNDIGDCLDIAEGVGSKDVGGKWTHVRYDASVENAFRSSKNPQPLHTDGSYQSESPDLTCMYCIANAADGGETIFISAENLVNILKNENPSLLEKLQTVPVSFSREFSNGANEKTRPIIDKNKDDRLILSWNYYRVAPSMPASTKDMCEQFHQFLQSRIVGSSDVLEVKLRPGEGVIWRDERLLHGRNGFTADKYAERDLAKTAIKLL